MTRSCWCGAPDLQRFSDEYFACANCGTLVSSFQHDRDVAHVGPDEANLYGKDYWFGHMEKDLGFANIYDRARSDLSERCLYWLRTLLNYRTPPARILELGSAHGGFVAALNWAGFEATGLELSPTIAQIARDLFGVQILVGPVEDQTIAPRSLDIVVLMDVLEHLPDPVSTIRHTSGLLKPGGCFVIQTPRFPLGCSLDEMRSGGDRFVEMLKADEHLYLYSESSARRLFSDAGLTHFAFEPALFSHYDMFFLASDAPIHALDDAQRDDALLRTPRSRMMLAMLDLQKRVDSSVPRAVFEAAELDREARLRVIERQGHELGLLEERRGSLQGEIDGLRRAFEASESDREARLQVIQRQGQELGEAQRGIDSMASEIGELKRALEENAHNHVQTIEQQQQELSEAVQNNQKLLGELDEARRSLEATTRESHSRQRTIESQGRELDEAQRTRAGLVEELERLRRANKLSEDERLANLRVVDQQKRALEDVHKQVSRLQKELQDRTSRLDSAESSRSEALANIDRQSAELAELATSLADARARLTESSARVSQLEETNKEMLQMVNRGIFQLIFDTFRGRR